MRRKASTVPEGAQPQREKHPDGYRASRSAGGKAQIFGAGQFSGITAVHRLKRCLSDGTQLPGGVRSEEFHRIGPLRPERFPGRSGPRR